MKEQLPIMGHRNWVVVADSAYPSQTAPGVKTIYTGEKQLDIVRKVLAAVEKVKHVRGTVFVDAELPHVPEKHAKGITAYRAGLKKALKGRNVTSLPHEKIIEQLDAAGQTFHV
ncbi:MAG: RbsD/FucU domain-containing protein [Limisphaerales bacterium]